MSSIGAVDLHEAVGLAVALSKRSGQPTVVCGALAMAAHGYRRETDDVDIVVPVVIHEPSGNLLEVNAQDLGLKVKTTHGFGGLDLRAGDIRIDVLTLDKIVPTLVPDAVEEAVKTGREIVLYGHPVFVVSLGHLIAMKIVAGRRKDLADIVELIKARIGLGEWDGDLYFVKKVVNQHLGVANLVDGFAAEAKMELGR